MSCPACFQGGVSASHPTGKETTVHGLATYVAEPEENATPKGIIVFITDAFGWDFVNNRVLCDHYAKGEFLVYCPDLMNGNPLQPFLRLFYQFLRKFHAIQSSHTYG
jgi:dienelactone hydrolase